MRLGVLSETGRVGMEGIGVSVSDGGTIGGATTGSGPSGVLTTNPCPTGYQLDPTGQVCIPLGSDWVGTVQSTGTLPCLPPGTMGPPAQGQEYCVTPASGSDGTTTPTSSLIAGIPNTALYVAGGILAAMLFLGKR